MRWVVGEHLAERRTPAGVVAPLALLDQAEEDATAEILLLGREPGIDRVRLSLQRPLDLADVAIHPDRQAVGLATPPQFLEGELEQRQRAGAAADVVHQQLDQPRLGLQAGQPRGAVDGAAELVVGHRADEHLVVGERGGQVGVGGTAG